MKKYFTKLLPVSKDIKRGDIVMGENGVCTIWGHESKYELQFHDDETIGFIKNAKKAKMFICSFDYEIGDEVYPSYDMGQRLEIIGWEAKEYLFDINDPHKVQKIYFDDTWKEEGCRTDHGYSPRRSYFKIIGTISDNAVWIKNNEVLYEPDINLVGYSGVVKVKCQNCKMFH